jgi:hypothetical protein
MTTVLVTVAAALAVWSSAHAQPPEGAVAGWPRQVGTTGFDLWDSVATSSTGDVYVVGATTGAFPGFTNAGASDLVVARFDRTGRLVWLRQFGTGSTDTAYGIAVSGTTVAVAGTTSGAFAGSANQGSQDAVVVRFDTAGNQVWLRQFGTDATDYVSGIAVSGTSVYVAGSTYGAFPGWTNQGAEDAFVARFDGNGARTWVTMTGGADTDAHSGIAAAGTAVYVIGDSGGAAAVSRFTSAGARVWTKLVDAPETALAAGVAVVGSALYATGYLGEQDGFVARFDTAGRQAWLRRLDEVEVMWAVAASSSGVVSATLASAASGGASLVTRFDTTGNPGWTRRFDRQTEGTFVGVTLRSGDANGGGVVAVGSTLGAAWGQAAAGATDALITTMPTSGGSTPTTTTGWPRQLGTGGDDEVLASATSASGEVYLAGRTHGAFPGAVNQGGYDAFLARLGADGRLLWVRQWGTSGDDTAAAVAVAGTAVYVAGTRPGLARLDGFVARYTTAGARTWLSEAPDSELTAIAVAGSRVVAGGTSTGFGGRQAVIHTFTSSGGSSCIGVPYSTGISEVAGIAATSTAAFIAGRTDGSFTGTSNAGGLDGFISRFDLDCNVAWTRQFGTAGYDDVAAVAVAGTALIAAGATNGAFPGNPNLGFSDGFVTRFDLTGTQTWLRQFGTAGYDDVNALNASATRIHLAGSTGGAFPGYANIGDNDGFVTRYDTDGTRVWTRQFGTAGNDWITSLTTRANDTTGGAVVATGWTTGTVWGQTSAGGIDALAAPGLS